MCSTPLAVPLLPISDRQDLYSTSFVRAVIGAAGYNFSKPELDRRSNDVSLNIGDAHETVTPHYQHLRLQVKCTYAHNPASDGYIHYPLKVANYNDLIKTNGEPRLLILVWVPKPLDTHPDPWIEWKPDQTVFRYLGYWLNLMGQGAAKSKTTVTVKVPVCNVFDVSCVRYLVERMVVLGDKNYAG